MLTASAFFGLLMGAAAPNVAAALEPFDSYYDKGALRLQLGQTEYLSASATLPENHVPVPPRFVYETQGKPDRTVFSQGPEQVFLLKGKCGGALDDSSTAAQLAILISGPGELGFGPDSIGVQDGPKGVACYRISADDGESIAFEIGPDLKSLGARTFYRLELDIEVKKNARFELEVLRAGETAATWVLESGASISPGSSDYPGANPWACTARSDSGPDSGAGDNCRWVINELGDGFRLTATYGEGSLEGGGDFGAEAYANNSVIYLTDAEVGVLGCETDLANGSPYTSTIGDGGDRAQCAVTRVDPSEVTGGSFQCLSNVGYVFRTVPSGIGGCELAKIPGEQLAAVLDVVFPREPRADLDDKAPTTIRFPDPASAEGYRDFVMPLCTGTLVPDANDDGFRTDDGGSPDPTIVEVLTNPETIGAFDVVLDTTSIEWACVLEDEEDYVGMDEFGDMWMQVRQRVLFWGDPIIIRQ